MSTTRRRPEPPAQPSLCIRPPWAWPSRQVLSSTISVYVSQPTPQIVSTPIAHIHGASLRRGRRSFSASNYASLIGAGSA